MNQLGPRIFVVEDEDAQQAALIYNLEAEGFAVQAVRDGDEALVILPEALPDVILLDRTPPGVSGIEICRQLRAREATRDIPIIMLSARTEEADRIRGLEMGADDYVTKPYSIAELIARIRSQLRRTRPASVGRQLTFQGILLDPETHKAFREGMQLSIGPTEFRLLTTLLERPGKVWSREQLLDRVWGRDIYVESRTVDVHVGRLRKALCRGGGEDPIRTVRGAGYSLG